MAEDLVIALAEVAAALILHDECVAAAHRLDRMARGTTAHVVLVVGRLPQYRRQLAGRALGPPDVGRQTDAVAHRHQHRGLDVGDRVQFGAQRSEEHTSELQSLMRISYAVFCLKKKTNNTL